MDKKSKIYVSGHNGMVGSAMIRLLKKEGFKNIVTRNSRDLDLRCQEKVNKFMAKENPEYVFLFAARVGGIKANMQHPAEFLYENLMIEANVIHASYKFKVKKLLFLGSSCIYPRDCQQPMKEDYLLTGKLEPTNEGYALAKVAGLKLCEYYNKEFNTNFICLMPPNLYGPGDDFDPDTSHVIPGLIRKFVLAKDNCFDSVEVWGTGKARREFLYVDDLAQACLYFMNKYDAKGLPPFLNVGYNSDISIKGLVSLIVKATGYKGKVVWDRTMPDGMARKLLSLCSLRKFKWKPKTRLEQGIKKTVNWYKYNQGIK